MKRLLIATHNTGKIADFRVMLAPLGIEIVSARDFALPEPEETEDTFLGNARIKAHAAARATGLPAVSDDSGFCIDNLGRRQGVNTADWEVGPSGTRDPANLLQRLNRELVENKLHGPQRTSVYCVLVIAWPDGKELFFSSDSRGEVVWPPRGTNGFGADPVFVPDGYHQTFAEMDPVLKSKLSHRGRAMACLLAHFAEAGLAAFDETPAWSPT